MVSAYWLSPAVNSKIFEIAKLFNYVSLGFFMADFVSTLSFDWSMLTGKRPRRWPHLAYFGTKYIWITYMITNLTVLWTVDELDCQLLMDFTELQMGLVVCFSSFLLACRTVCVFDGTARKVIIGVLIVFGAGLVAAWMQGVADVTSTWSTAAATPWNAGGCTYNAVKTTYWVKYVVTIAFDMLVLTLTSIGIIRMKSSSRIGDVLIKQGLIYFILTCAANLVVTVLTALRLSPVMSLFMAVPQSTVCVISSTRLYMMLAQQARPRNTAQVNSGSLRDEPFLASKFSSMIRRARGRDSGVIPFSPTQSDLSTDRKVSKKGSHASSSCEDLEKASSSPSTTRTVMVRVDRSRTVQVDTMLSHIFAKHSVSGPTPVVDDDEETIREDQVALQYPRLSRRGLP